MGRKARDLAAELAANPTRETAEKVIDALPDRWLAGSATDRLHGRAVNIVKRGR